MKINLNLFIRGQVDRFAAGLLKLGLNRGDRIAIWAPNTLQWYITLMSAAKAGLISVSVFGITHMILKVY